MKSKINRDEIIENIIDSLVPIESFSNDEIKTAFSGVCDISDIQLIRSKILPIVYGLGFDYLDFDGNNCDDAGESCNGWNGFSKRCCCGNRRVYWEKSGDDFVPTAW
jgi:hypothetical protein